MSLALLVGFYLLGILVVVASVAAIWLMIRVGRIQLGILIGAVVGTFGVIRGFLTSGAKFTGIPGSVQVSRSDQPDLLAMIEDVAQTMGADPPDEVYIVDDVNAFVLEDTRLLGLITRKRVMGIGMALVDSLTVDELRGVLAHEFGHYTGGDTRLAPVVYRGRESIVRTMSSLGDGILQAVYLWYFKLYLRTSMSISRRQELVADQWSVSVAGTEPTLSTHRRLGALGVAYASYLDRYVHGLWVIGRYPVNQFEGFRQFVAAPENSDSMAAAAASVLAQSEDPYDSHPSSAERIRQIQALAVVEAHGDSRSARDLLVDADALEASVGDSYRVAVWPGPRLAPVDWTEAGSAFAGSLQQGALLLQRVTQTKSASEAIAAVAGLPRSQRSAFTSSLVDRSEGPGAGNDALRESFASAIGEALVERGTHRWVLSWSGPIGLEPIGDAKPVDVWALADGFVKFDDFALARLRHLQLIPTITS